MAKCEALGGSEARDTVRKRIEVMGKNIREELEKRNSDIVVSRERGMTDDRASDGQWKELSACMEKDLGKDGKNGIDVLPCRVVPRKSECWPFTSMRPQPPDGLI